MFVSGTTALRQPALLYVPLRLLIVGSALFDLLLVTGAFLLAETVSGGFLAEPLTPTARLLVGAGLGIAFIAVMAFQEAYAQRTFRAIHGQAFAAAVSWLVTFFLAGWAAYVVAMPREGALSAIVTLYFTGFAVTVIGRGLFGAVLRHAISSGWIAVERAYVVSSLDNDARSVFLDHLRNAGITVVGMTTIDVATLRTEAGAASTAALVDLLSTPDLNIEAVHVLVPWQETDAISRLREAMRHVPHAVYLTSDRQLEAMAMRTVHRAGQRTGFEVGGSAEPH
ncbi:MAG: hypothetical protein ACK50Q_10465 [Labrys sp. (in: a-proteobacteria)]